MKTPRQILTERHDAMEPALDQLRHRLLDGLRAPQPCAVQVSHEAEATVWSAVWRELVVPARAAWLGLAAAWLLILGLQSSVRLSEPHLPSKPVASALGVSLMHERFLAAQNREGIEPVENPLPSPKPRSQNQGVGRPARPWACLSPITSSLNA